MIGSRQQGIALIQVLLITTIMMVLGLYFSLTAKQQVSLASLVSDRQQATMAITSARANLLMALLTMDSQTNTKNINGLNYYGKPFQYLDHVTVSIQDISGLINVQAPDADVLKRLLLRLGANSSQADTIVDSLADWQDKDDFVRVNGAEKKDYRNGVRNAPIVLLDEIAQVKGMTPTLAAALAPYLYFRGGVYFNPSVAPDLLLKAYLNNDAPDIITMRQQGAVSAESFRRQTGLEEREGLILSKSNVFRIKYRAQVGSATVQRSETVALDPYARGDEPVVELIETVWN